MKHLLLIDDNKVDNYISKIMVTKAKIAGLITVMESGVDALEFLKMLVRKGEAFPELIFLDINMPEMDGFQFLDEYRKFSEAAKECTSINMLTSSKNPDDVKKAGEYRYVKNFFHKLNAEMLEKIM